MKANYVVIDYTDDNYEEYSSISDVKDAIVGMVEEEDEKTIRQRLTDYDLVVIKGDILEVEIEKSVRISIE
jgi:hypothetical protein